MTADITQHLTINGTPLHDCDPPHVRKRTRRLLYGASLTWICPECEVPWKYVHDDYSCWRYAWWAWEWHRQRQSQCQDFVTDRLSELQAHLWFVA